MMIPSISLTKVIYGDNLVYTAACIHEGQILSKTENLSAEMQQSIPAEITDRVSTRHVAHTLLDKLLEDLR